MVGTAAVLPVVTASDLPAALTVVELGSAKTIALPEPLPRTVAPLPPPESRPSSVYDGSPSTTEPLGPIASSDPAGIDEELSATNTPLMTDMPPL
jgi:hypothetical protein